MSVAAEVMMAPAVSSEDVEKAESAERAVRNQIALRIKSEIPQRLGRRRPAGHGSRGRIVVAVLVDHDRQIESEHEPLPVRSDCHRLDEDVAKIAVAWARVVSSAII